MNCFMCGLKCEKDWEDERWCSLKCLEDWEKNNEEGLKKRVQLSLLESEPITFSYRELFYIVTYWSQSFPEFTRKLKWVDPGSFGRNKSTVERVYETRIDCEPVPA